MVHVILLVQFNTNPKNKIYHDCDSINDAVKHLCTLYEEKLKKSNINTSYITYDIMDLYQYIDQLHDLSILIDRMDENNYNAYGKQWIKQKIFHVLRNEVRE